MHNSAPSHSSLKPTASGWARGKLPVAAPRRCHALPVRPPHTYHPVHTVSQAYLHLGCRSTDKNLHTLRPALLSPLQAAREGERILKKHSKTPGGVGGGWLVVHIWSVAPHWLLRAAAKFLGVCMCVAEPPDQQLPAGWSGAVAEQAALCSSSAQATRMHPASGARYQQLARAATPVHQAPCIPDGQASSQGNKPPAASQGSQARAASPVHSRPASVQPGQCSEPCEVSARQSIAAVAALLLLSCR